MDTIEVTIDIHAENPSGYAGDDTTIYVQCLKDKVDIFLLDLDTAIEQVLKRYNLQD